MIRAYLLVMRPYLLVIRPSQARQQYRRLSQSSHPNPLLEVPVRQYLSCWLL